MALAAENVKLLRENCELSEELLKKQSVADCRHHVKVQAAAPQDGWDAEPWTSTLRAYLSTVRDDGRDCFEVISEFVESLDDERMRQVFGAAEGEQQLLDIQEQMGQFIEAYRQFAAGGP